jgi:hypothetical protein
MNSELKYQPLGMASAVHIEEPTFVEGVKYNPITLECSAPNENVFGAIRAYMSSSTTITKNSDSDFSSDI